MQEMEPKLISVYFGGEWKKSAKGLEYIGKTEQKAFVITGEMTIEELKEKVRQRFNVIATCELKFSHLHPFMKLNAPYKVDSDGDFKEYLEISAMDGVGWTLPLYSTVSVGDNCKGRADVADTTALVGGSYAYSSGFGMTGNDSFNSVMLENNVMMIEQGIDNNDEAGWDEDERSSEEMYKANRVYLIKQREMGEFSGSVGGGQRHHDLMNVGKIFSSKEELRTAVTMMSLADTFGYKVKKSTPKYFRARCVDDKCEWAIHSSRVQGTESFEVKKFTWKHTCTLETRSSRCRKATAKIVAEKIKARYEEDRGPKARAIQDIMRKDHKMNVSYWKCWKAREMAEELQKGTPENSYELLPSYCYVLKQKNPGTYTSILKGDGDRFKYVFVSFGASVRGYSQLKKVIIVDGTFLTGRYGGTFLIATAQDVNNQLYPIAFAIVDSENNHSWGWFFKELVKLIPEKNELVFVSDHHKSIGRAIEEVYPSAKHYFCTFHLKQNLRVKFKKKGLCTLFSSAAESYTAREFQESYAMIWKTNPAMWAYLEEAGVEKWARAIAKRDRYNIMTSNSAESVNSIMRTAKGYPIITVLNHMREKLSEWFNARRVEAMANGEELPSKVLTLLNERCKEIGRYNVKQLKHWQFEIVGEERVMVDLFAKNCTCKVFDLDKIPCVHAIAAIVYKGLKIADYVNYYYSNEAYKVAYIETIYPVLHESEWVVPDEIKRESCHPPIVRRKSGRPTKKRKLSIGELRKTVRH